MFIRPSHSRFYLFIYFYLFYRSICSACVRFLTVLGAVQMSDDDDDYDDDDDDDAGMFSGGTVNFCKFWPH